MKLILFMYFSAVYSHKPKNYTAQLHSKALSIIFIQWGLFFSSIILSVLHDFNVWDWLITHWPYEYGRTHSRNWTTPSAVFAILFSLIFHQCIKFYFGKESVQQEIVAHY